MIGSLHRTAQKIIKAVNVLSEQAAVAGNFLLSGENGGVPGKHKS